MVPDGTAAAQKERGSGSEWPKACTLRSLRSGSFGATSSGNPSPTPYLGDLDLLVVWEHGGVFSKSPEDSEHVLERGTKAS